MKQWHDIMRKVLEHGTQRQDRTGVGTLALFGEQLEFDNSSAFPAVTTKKLAFGQVKAELACFLRGYDNLKQFHEMGCTIWDDNGSSDYWLPRARSVGDLGRVYGVQWRDWQSVEASPNEVTIRSTDQLTELVEGLNGQPHSRRHVITALNPGEADQMCLPPCHVLFQCFVSGGFLDLRVDMRSVDLFLGLPFDVASYALLQRLLAKETGLHSRRLVFQLGDAHIYMNHLAQVREVLARDPLPPPLLGIDVDASLCEFLPEQARFVDYQHHSAVKALLNI